MSYGGLQQDKGGKKSDNDEFEECVNDIAENVFLFVSLGVNPFGF